MFRTMVRGIGGTALAFALVACGQPATSTTTPATSQTTTGEAASMDHGAMGQDTTAGPSNAAPYDAQFIDDMIAHHRGAVTMAKQALKESERAEIKELAQNIVATQEQEITKMTAWRTQWYPDLPQTSGTGMAMGDMQLSDDTSLPFDQRFITSMISHHQGAIAMARDAQTKAQHSEIKELAGAIITAQEAEISQMEQIR